MDTNALVPMLHTDLMQNAQMPSSEGVLRSATSMVLGYIEKRSSEQTAGVDASQAELSELRKKVDRLQAYIGQLEESLRLAQIGFRRHHSDHVDSSQLALVIEHEVQQAQDNASQESTKQGNESEPQGSNELAAGSDASNGSDEPNGSDPAKKANRRNHPGRRDIATVPELIIEVVPDEVREQGTGQFKQIGYEDTEIVGYRRGGLIKLVYRRFKYVRSEQGERATSKVTTGEAAAESIVVLESEHLRAMDDSTSKHNPFVDGAIVRCFPTQSVDQDARILIAPTMERPIDKALADTSLLAHLLCDKYQRHLPYYRQEAELSLFGYTPNRTDMSRWQYQCGTLLKPLTDAMWKEALARDWFAMDATGTAIRGSPSHSSGHIHVLVAPGQSTLYRFSLENNGDIVFKLFGESNATIIADSSSCHNKLFASDQRIHAGCWAHAQRKFVTAFRAGEGAQCASVLMDIKELFRIEREIKDFEPEARRQHRQCVSKPIVDKLLAMAEQSRHAPRAESLTRAGFVYLDNQKQALQQFLEDGQIPMHNNMSEAALRRLVKGRLNWLFHYSDKHADAACVIISLIASAEMHGLDPEFYLQEILTVAPSYPISRIIDLAPDNWLETRKRLMDEGTLRYLDIASMSGSRLRFRGV